MDTLLATRTAAAHRTNKTFSEIFSKRVQTGCVEYSQIS